MDLELWRNYSIFTGMDDDQIGLLIDKMKLQELPADKDVFKEGDYGTSIILLLSGEVNISHSLTLKVTKNQVGEKEKSLEVLKSEYFPIFGEMAVFDDMDNRSATVTTKTSCTLGIFENETILKQCEKHPEIGFHFMKNIGKILSDRLRKANLDIKKLTTAFSLILGD